MCLTTTGICLNSNAVHALIYQRTQVYILDPLRAIMIFTHTQGQAFPVAS